MGVSDGVVVAVDGGGSKTDVLAVALDGEVVGRARAGGSSPHMVGVERSVAIIDGAVQAALATASGRAVRHAGIYLSGIDLPPEAVAFEAAVAHLAWTQPTTVVDNDLFAVLRAGTRSPDALAVVCGTGINGMGIRADGVTARFAALGPISGDWGGGSGLGESALWHAARAEDGRGPATLLRDAVLRQMGVASIAALIEDIHFGRRSAADLADLSPSVFAVANAGDETAISLVDRLAEEVVCYVRAMVDRLELQGKTIPLVLGGAVLRANEPLLLAGISERLSLLPCQIQVVLPSAPPVLGAALLALESVGAQKAALDRLESQLTPA